MFILYVHVYIQTYAFSFKINNISYTLSQSCRHKTQKPNIPEHSPNQLPDSNAARDATSTNENRGTERTPLPPQPQRSPTNQSESRNRTNTPPPPRNPLPPIRIADPNGLRNPPDQSESRESNLNLRPGLNSPASEREAGGPCALSLSHLSPFPPPIKLFSLSAMPHRIYYSDKYYDEKFEYR